MEIGPIVFLWNENEVYITERQTLGSVCLGSPNVRNLKLNWNRTIQSNIQRNVYFIYIDYKKIPIVKYTYRKFFQLL